MEQTTQAVKVNYSDTAAYKHIAAAMCRRYAQANRDTYERTGGRRGSLYMAEVYDACAARHERAAQIAEAVQS